MPQMKNMSSMYLSQLKWRRKLRSNSGSTFLFEFFHQIQVYKYTKDSWNYIPPVLVPSSAKI